MIFFSSASVTAYRKMITEIRFALWLNIETSKFQSSRPTLTIWRGANETFQFWRQNPTPILSNENKKKIAEDKSETSCDGEIIRKFLAFVFITGDKRDDDWYSRFWFDSSFIKRWVRTP